MPEQRKISIWTSRDHRLDRVLLLCAVLGLIALSYWFNFLTQTEGLGQAIATLGTQGQVKRRGSRSLSWNTLTGEETLYLGDTVFTPPNTSAQVLFPSGTTFQLEPNSMVQFDEVSPNQVDLVILKGNFVIKKDSPTAPAPLKKTNKIEEWANKIWKKPAPAVTLKTSAPRVVVHTMPKMKPRISAAPPKVVTRATERAAQRLSRGGSPSVIRNMNFMQPLDAVDPLWKDHLSINTRLSTYDQKFGLRPLKPLSLDFSQLTLNQMGNYNVILVEPPHYGTVIEPSNCIQLVWTPIPLRNIGYYVEVSRDKMFRYVRSFGTEENSIKLLLNDNSTEYFWRVRAVMGDDSLVSNLHKFTIPRDEREIAAAEQGKSQYLPQWEVCYK